MKALVTYATGPMAELGEIARPSFEVFAKRHGYDLRVYDPDPDPFWPIPWMKVACLQDALQTYDAALWLDCDIVIVDPSEDIPCDGWQSLAVHHTQDGEVPNTGVWFCRREMSDVLASMWTMTTYRNHPWWEQGALLELLGYDSWARPTVFRGRTDLYDHTQYLGTEWNSHPWDEAEKPRFLHATMRPDRAAIMREWAAA